MSKKHGTRKRHRKKAGRKFTCSACRQPAGQDWSLLASVAAALNACVDAGNPVKLRWGIVTSREGYVVPLSDGHWGARNLNYESFGVPPADDEIGDGMDD